MDIRLERLVEGFVKNPGADQSVVSQTVAALGVALPTDYLELLQHMDGGEGFIGNEYFRLYAVEKIIPLNVAYAVDEFVPGLLVFGSNGGGEAFAFDTRSTPVSIVRIPFIPLHVKYCRPLGTTLLEAFLALGQGSGDASRAPAALPNREVIGKEVHEVQPVVFGGDPLDLENKVLLDPEEYAKYVVWWNRKYRDMSMS